MSSRRTDDSSPLQLLDEADLSRCVRCGLCLQSCPTYVELGLETESPRGRLYLIRALASERVQPTPNVLEHLDLCLQCRNCEAVCPSGVPYGSIMEAARAEIMDGPKAPFSWKLRRFLLRLTIAHPGQLMLMGTLIRFYHWSGLRALAEQVLPPRWKRLSQLTPVPKGRPFRRMGSLARPSGTVKARVALLTGCIMPEFYGDVHRATVRVLARNGCEVQAPLGQTCCGALFAHSGDRESAIRLAKRNIDAFLNSGADVIVTNAAGCGAAMKEYSHLLQRDPEYSEKANRFSALVKDILEFLNELPFQPPTRPLKETVTYQDSCHLAHAQRVREAPRAILRSIPGLRLMEMEHPDRCCGSAGIYNLTNREMSSQLLDSKMKEADSTGARVIATANPGCILQLEAGAKQRNLDCSVVHVIELLDRAYKG
ncbi:MAG TPA: heterodisulfide reductase-related iron-sulfur binding cluster [Dehalococcoidia bacterium]|nr:heterodisulfide reductase-related iron-sulfur binding cluster [Dehalococcoidia bacterium]